MARSLRGRRKGLIRAYSPRRSASHSASTAARVGSNSTACQNRFSCSLRQRSSGEDESPGFQPFLDQHAVVVPSELGDVGWLDDHGSRGSASLNLTRNTARMIRPSSGNALSRALKRAKDLSDFRVTTSQGLPPKKNWTSRSFTQSMPSMSPRARESSPNSRRASRVYFSVPGNMSSSPNRCLAKVLW